MSNISRLIYRIMLLLSAAVGINTLIWLCFGPAVHDHRRFLLWSNLTTPFTLFVLVLTFLSILIKEDSWRGRIRWLLFSVFGGPFGPWCFWECSIVLQSTRLNVRGLKTILIVSVMSIFAVWLLCGARVTNATILRGFFAFVVLSVIWWITWRTRGERYIPIWIAVVCFVGMQVVLSSLPL